MRLISNVIQLGLGYTTVESDVQDGSDSRGVRR